jgi:peptidoglycan/LPS O-acetylase OafA/YrhL
MVSSCDRLCSMNWNAPLELERKPQTVVALDLLRGLAAIAVLLFHVRAASFDFSLLPPTQKAIAFAVFGITSLGNVAVLVFFVLSGFLVGGQIIARAQSRTFDLTRYVLNRCTRIFLPLIPACLLTVIINLVVFHEGTGIAPLVANMVGLNEILVPTLHNNPPLWSLAYEIWFYVLGGAMGYLAINRGSVGGVLTVALSVVIFSVLAAPYLLYWALGALMVLFLNTRYQGWLFLAGSALAAIGTVTYELSFPGHSYASVSYIPVEVSRAFLCVGTGFALPFLCSARVENCFHHLRRPAKFLAAISYTLYLTHYPINSALDVMFPKFTVLTWESVGCFGARIGICLSAATIMYFCFERNMPMLKKWLAQPSPTGQLRQISSVLSSTIGPPSRAGRSAPS